MKMNSLITKCLFLALICLTSCSDDDEIIVVPKGDYENGLLISGEGSGAGTGSISFVSNDLSESENLIYKKVNNVELGTFLQSIAFDDDSAYIIVDNTNTITVVDRYTFEFKNEIIVNLSTPRFMTVVGDKGYVTNWGSTSDDTDDFIAVVDLQTFAVDKTISVGNGPERIIAKDGKLYVSHKGAFTNNNIVSVITITTEEVEEITVKDKPDELVFNNAGDLVVLSEGRTLYDANWNVTGHTLASISTIDVSTLVIDTALDFELGAHPSLMVLDNNTIYYALGNDIFAMDADATALPGASLLTAEGYLYGMAVGGNRIYATNASFTDVSALNIYDLASQDKIDTKEIALGASKIYFN